MSVLVIVPVLNRPHRVEPLVENFVASTDGDADLLFVASAGDDAEINAIRGRRQTTRTFLDVVPWAAGPGDYARKINHGARKASKQGYAWVFTGADDLTFHADWLDNALKIGTGKAAAVVGTNDLWNPAVRMRKHSTHSLVNVEYVTRRGAGWDGPGVLLHEGYDHQCVDNELVAAAKMRDVWAFAQQSVVEHLHPFAHKSPMDETYRKALARGREDIALYKTRLRNAQAEIRKGSFG